MMYNVFAQGKVHYCSFRITDTLGYPMSGWRFTIISKDITSSTADKDGNVDFVLHDNEINYDRAKFHFTVGCESKDIKLIDIMPFQDNPVDGFIVTLLEYKVYDESNIPCSIKRHDNYRRNKSKCYYWNQNRKWKKARKPVEKNMDYYEKYLNNCSEPFAIDVD